MAWSDDLHAEVQLEFDLAQAKEEADQLTFDIYVQKRAAFLANETARHRVWWAKIKAEGGPLYRRILKRAREQAKARRVPASKVPLRGRRGDGLSFIELRAAERKAREIARPGTRRAIGAQGRDSAARR